MSEGLKNIRKKGDEKPKTLIVILYTYLPEQCNQ